MVNSNIELDVNARNRAARKTIVNVTSWAFPAQSIANVIHARIAMNQVSTVATPIMKT